VIIGSMNWSRSTSLSPATRLDPAFRGLAVAVDRVAPPGMVSSTAVNLVRVSVPVLSELIAEVVASNGVAHEAIIASAHQNT